MIDLINSKTTYSQIDYLSEMLNKEEDLNSNNIIITEDRFTLTLEQEILKRKTKKGSFSTSIFSFERLTQTLSKNLPAYRTLTKTGEIMAISKILYDNQSKFYCYNNIAKNYSTLSQSLFELISQLKSSNVTPDVLSGFNSKSIALQNKIKDIALIYEEYEKFKKQTLLDAQDRTELLCKLIPDSDYIKKSNIYIVGFTSFTKQFYEVITRLFLNAKNVSIFILKGENKVYDDQVEKNIKEILLRHNLKANDITINEKMSPEIKGINENLFSFKPANLLPSIDSNIISIYEGTNYIDELNHISIEILKDIKNNNYKFSDIQVITSNLEENIDTIKKVFSYYSIPAFLDNKIKLSSHILSRVIIAILTLSSNKFEMTDFYTILFSPYFNSNSELTQEFENYLLSKGINKRNIKSRVLDEPYEELKNKVLSVTPDMKPVEKVSYYVKHTRKILEKIIDKNEKVYSLFQEASENEFAEFTIQTNEKFNDILTELEEIIGDTQTTLEDFIHILFDGLSAKDLSLAPLYTDQVFVGDYSSSKFGKKKIVYAISANNRLVPSLKNDEGLLSDKDLEKLSADSIIIEPKIEEINDREQLNVFLSLHNFKDKLSISYSIYSLDSKELKKSDFINTLERMFNIKPIRQPNSANLDDEALSSFAKENYTSLSSIKSLAAEYYSEIQSNNYNNINGYLSISNALKQYDDNALNALASNEIEYIPKVYENKTNFSVSELETYFSCPFKNFIQRGLYAQDRDVAIVKVTDTGNYIHECLERFMEKYDTLDEASAKKLEKEITSSIKKKDVYDNLLKYKRFQIALERLDKEFYKVCDELMNRKPLVSFVGIGQEIKFGYNRTITFNGKDIILQPLVLNNGVKLVGSVDYADAYNGYVRVIDYKTGHISPSISAIYNGHKIQPYIYLAALNENLGLKPSGAFYFPINNKFNKENDPPYKMKGFFLNDEIAYTAMDKNLDQPGAKSEIIPAVIKTKGGLSGKPHNGFVNEEFNALIDYSKAISVKATNELKKGYVLPKPYDKSCDYCKYHGICGYDCNYLGSRKINGDIKVDTIKEALNNDK